MVLSPFYRESYLVGGPHVSKFRSVEMCKYVSVYYIGTTKAELTRGYPLIGIPIKAIGVHELEVGGPGIMEHLRGQRLWTEETHNVKDRQRGLSIEIIQLWPRDTYHSKV